MDFSHLEQILGDRYSTKFTTVSYIQRCRNLKVLKDNHIDSIDHSYWADARRKYEAAREQQQ
ncbi:hypothetical protein DFQ27_007160, partial [Actinomortierella ambigua]